MQRAAAQSERSCEGCTTSRLNQMQAFQMQAFQMQAFQMRAFQMRGRY
jgi:hypothetical protein